MNQGMINYTHGDEHAHNMHTKEVFAPMKFCACKSVKTPLSSTPMLFKVASCFHVWKQTLFDTIRSDIHNLFHNHPPPFLVDIINVWFLCSTCENNFNSTHPKLILNSM